MKLEGMDNGNGLLWQKVGVVAAIIGVVVTIIGVTVAIIQAVRSNGESVNYGVILEDVETGNDVNIDNSIDNSVNTFYYLNAVDEFELAAEYMKSGDYDLARRIYEKKEYSADTLSLINLGYIYVNNGSAEQDSINKAITCYKKADVVEADRNLLALYLKNGMKDEALVILEELLEDGDVITWDFLSYSIFGISSQESGEAQRFEDITSSNVMNRLFEWEETSGFYSGFNPPDSTGLIKWVPCGMNFVCDGGSINHPTLGWREYRAKCANYINMLEKCYYTKNENLIPLE